MIRRSECTFIKMPNKIYMTEKCIKKILSEFNERDISKKIVVFNFENTTWLSAEVTPLIGVLIKKVREDGKKVKFFKLKEDKVRKILKKNGFMEYYNIDDRISDIHGTTIPYKVLDSKDDEEIDLFLEEHVFSLINQYIDEEEIEIIRDAVNEISHNVKDHSTKSNVYFCGQFYPQKKYITLTLCDNGVTIPYNIKRKYDFIKNSSRALNFATEKGNSTKHSASSGLGLFDIKNNIFQLGELSILSGKAFWKQDFNGEITSNTSQNTFPGTLVSLKFYLDDHKNRKYLSKSDTIDLDETINLVF